MSRMYDRLLRGKSFSPQGKREIDFHEMLLDAETLGLPKPLVVDTSNVSSYWTGHLNAEMLKPAELPSLAPPWESFFMEYPFDIRNLPGETLEEVFPDGIFQKSQPMTRVGLFGIGHDRYSDDDNEFENALSQFGDEWGGDRESVRFILTLIDFWEYGKGQIKGPMGVQRFPLYSDGTIVPSRYGTIGSSFEAVLDFDEDLTEKENETLGYFAKWTAMPGLLAISLCHCRNVKSVPVSPPEKPSRKHHQRYGEPLTKYYTLEIGPMTEVLENEGRASQNGLKKALHICRGHFATYSPNKPLFGKYAGTFWKPQHVKGSKKHGKVVKDYTVRSPNA